jgi:hypothetical protein
MSTRPSLPASPKQCVRGPARQRPGWRQNQVGWGVEGVVSTGGGTTTGGGVGVGSGGTNMPPSQLKDLNRSRGSVKSNVVGLETGLGRIR